MNNVLLAGLARRELARQKKEPSRVIPLSGILSDMVFCRPAGFALEKLNYFDGVDLHMCVVPMG